MKIINNRYEVIGEIDRGEFGVIYEVIDRADNDIVKALKMYNSDKLGDNFLLRFKKEYATLSRCYMPNVVRVYDFERVKLIDGVLFSGKYYFYTMEKSEGTVLKQYKFRKEEQKKELFETILINLKWLHANGYVHGDLNASNIMITKSGNIIFLDIDPDASAEKDLKRFKELCESFSVNYHAVTRKHCGCEMIADRFNLTLDFLPDILQDVSTSQDSIDKNKERVKIVNCASYNPVFYRLVSGYFKSTLQIKGYDPYEIIVCPNFYSFFTHLLFLLRNRKEYESILEKESFIISYIDNYTSNLNDKTAANAFSFEIHDALLKLIEKLSYVSPLVFIIDNYHYIDGKSLEALHYIWKHYTGNSVYFIFSSTESVNRIKNKTVAVETINLFKSKDEFLKDKNSFYEKSGIKSKIEQLFFNYELDELHKLFESMTTENLLTLLTNSSYMKKMCSANGNKIVVDIRHHEAMIVSSENVIMEQIFSHESIKKLFTFFIYMDKPVRIDMLEMLMNEPVEKYILLLLKANIFSKVDENRILPYDIAVYHAVREKIKELVTDEDTHIAQILQVYERFEQDLNESERFLYVYYRCTEGNYSQAAQWIERYYLIPLTVNHQWLIQLFDDYLHALYQQHSNSFSFIENQKDRALFELFYCMLHFYGDMTRKKSFIAAILKNYTDISAILVIKMFKIKTYIDLGEIDAIEADLNYVYQRFTDFSISYQILLMRHLAMYYYTKWDFAKAIECAHDVIRLMTAECEPKIFWGLMTTIFRSYIYLNKFKRAYAIGEYLRKKAEESKQDQWMFMVYNAFNIYWYRQQEYAKARESMAKALLAAESTYDYESVASAYNNMGLLTDRPEDRVGYYMKSLEYSKVTNYRGLYFTTLCNLLLFYHDTVDYPKMISLLEDNEKIIFSETKSNESSLVRRHLHIMFFSLLPLYFYKKSDWIQRYLLILEKITLKKDSAFYQLKTVTEGICNHIIDLLSMKTTFSRTPFINNMIQMLENNGELKDEDHFILRAYYTWVLPFMTEKERKLLVHRSMEQFTDGTAELKPFDRFAMYYKLHFDSRLQKNERKQRYIELYYSPIEDDFWDSFSDYFKYSILIEYMHICADSPCRHYSVLMARAHDWYKKLTTAVPDANLIKATYWNVLIGELKQKLPDYEKIVHAKLSATIKNYGDFNALYKVFQTAYYDESVKTERLMRVLMEVLHYERVILYAKTSEGITEEARFHDKKMFYHRYESTVEFLPEFATNNDIVIRNNLSGTVRSYMVIPLVTNRDYNRQKFQNIYFPLSDDAPVIRGFIYLDRKVSCTIKYDMQKLQILMMYLSLLWENREIEAKYMRDPLTKLFFRDVFISKIRDYIYNDDHRTKHFVLMMIDIDHFKTVNDLYGHQKGDEVLAQVAEIIGRSLRKNDLIGRYGGEEFIVALLNHHLDGGMRVAERIRKNIERSKLLGTLRTLTISIGVVEYPTDAIWIDELICKADECLYRAKKHGRNRVITVL